MAIEYNKELHIQLLRDEIILTREELEKKYRTHRTFCEIVNEVHSTIRLEELKEIARDTIETILNLEKYALIVWDKNEKHFIIMESRNMEEEDEAEALKRLESIRKWSDLAAPDDMIYLPLNEGKTLLGALCVPEKEYQATAKGSGEVLRLAVGQLTRALENSVMYEDALKHAVTDDKTALFNHRYMQGRLEVELKRAGRFGHELAVLMVDIDDFKTINDSYGHLRGDMVLAETAKMLRQSCRDIDILARFGGDEFTVIMPETDIFGAHVLAERILRATKKHRFDTGHGFEASITVSIGVATCPGNGRHARELMERADKALIEAKQKGKNCFIMATGMSE